MYTASLRSFSVPYQVLLYGVFPIVICIESQGETNGTANGQLTFSQTASKQLLLIK